jgi:cytochrome c oxidase subunit 2
MFRFLPEQASTIAPKVDFLNNLVTDLSVFFTVAIVGTMLYFALKYRRREGVDHTTPRIEGSHTLEIIWTAVPTGVCVFLAWAGISVYNDMKEVPENAMTINVTGWKWAWEFQYQNGKKSGGQGAELVVPVNQPIKLVMTSKDVIHSFFIPAMRVKQDVVPGKYSYVSFTPVKTGLYDVFCTEYCGTRHAYMMAKVRVVSAEEFEAWVNHDSSAGLPPAELGKQLYTSLGCNACHSLADGVRIVGPSFYKSYGHKGKLADGAEYVVDENYIQESILYPNKKIVEGYPANVMPSYDGRVDTEQLNALIAFIKAQDGSVPPAPAVNISLGDEAEDLSKLSPAERGKKLYTAKACVGCHSLDGSPMVGPTFKGAYGGSRELQDGSTVVADDAYVTESILKPMAKVRKGYAPVMPAYEGQLSDSEVKDLIEFIKTVK